MGTTGSGWDLPQGVTPWSNFHWFRVSPRKPLKCVVLSKEPTWYAGHFVQQRMWPCRAPHCSHCDDGMGRQIRFVLAIAELETHRVGLIEFSESLSNLLRCWIPECEGLRGMCLEFSKHTAQVRSRTEVELLRGVYPNWFQELQVPDAKLALELTWQKAGFPPPVRSEKAPSEYRSK